MGPPSSTVRNLNIIYRKKIYIYIYIHRFLLDYITTSQTTNREKSGRHLNQRPFRTILHTFPGIFEGILATSEFSLESVASNYCAFFDFLFNYKDMQLFIFVKKFREL